MAQAFRASRRRFPACGARGWAHYNGCYLSLQKWTQACAKLLLDNVHRRVAGAAGIPIGSIMSRKRLHSAFLATCFIAMLAGMRVQAADITIARDAMPASVTKSQPVALPARPAAKVRPAKAKKAREPMRARKIITYNLFDDPAFKLAGAVSDMQQLRTPAPAIGDATPLADLPRSRSRAPALKMDAAASDVAGLAFDCRKKTSGPNPFRLGMTACYKARLDKSWQTQTYISKGFADGDPEWGGGLSISYAH